MKKCHWSLSIPTEIIRKPLVFWCFQGVWKGTGGAKWVKLFYGKAATLTLSWRRSLSYRIHSSDLQSKSVGWFLCDRDSLKKCQTNTCLFSVNINKIFTELTSISNRLISSMKTIDDFVILWNYNTNLFQVHIHHEEAENLIIFFTDLDVNNDLWT